MLVDINSYIGHWPFRPLQGNTLKATLKLMNKRGVNKSIIANINGIFYQDSQYANEELYAAIQSNDAFKSRFVPIAVLDPLVPWWEKALETCHEKLGMKGVRLFPLYHKYSMTDERCINLVKATRDRGMPISIPLRMIDLRQRSWLDVSKQLSLNEVAALIKEVPDAQYTVLDMREIHVSPSTTGNVPKMAQPTTNETMQIFKNADVLFDTTRASGVPVKGSNRSSLHHVLKTYGPKSLAFGTETPFTDYCTSFIDLTVFKGADAKTKKLIWGENARRMYKI
jgi:predicted TIM-barrel fold metal-dependent hydrolase